MLTYISTFLSEFKYKSYLFINTFDTLQYEFLYKRAFHKQNNQAHTSQNPAHTWFLEIVLSRKSVCMCVCVCLSVCPSSRLLKTFMYIKCVNRQSNKSYCFSVSLYGNIIDEWGHSNEARCELLPKKR